MIGRRDILIEPEGGVDGVKSYDCKDTNIYNNER